MTAKREEKQSSRATGTPAEATGGTPNERGSDDRLANWYTGISYLAWTAGCLAVFWVGISWIAVACAVFLYLARMFFLTAFYHRYFAHRSFRTSRIVQFIGAAGGCAALQRGPIWWAAHHRHHHYTADTELDRHSPAKQGLLYSHMGWFMSPENKPTDEKYVADWMKLPELRFINRFYWLMGILLVAGLLGAGALLEAAVEAKRISTVFSTSAGQLFVWGFFISTIALYHGSFSINSLGHKFGRRRFKTTDDSRNSFLLSLITLGEGWHNNHHHYSSSARSGFRWWELDATYYILKALSWTGIVWNLRPVPEHVLAEARSNRLESFKTEQEETAARELETAT